MNSEFGIRRYDFLSPFHPELKSCSSFYVFSMVMPSFSESPLVVVGCTVGVFLLG